MDKEIVDNTIIKYIKKIYGFSLTKTKSIDFAEELSSRIVFEVYKALLKSDNVHNVDGYVYRIANNVYARFVSEEMNNNALLEKPLFQTEKSHDKEESYTLLRKEIAYLSKIQREIIILHYFDNLKLKDISERLSLTLGTVKWHLHEARNQIKESFIETKNKSSKQKEMVFSEMKNLGSLSPYHADMNYFFFMNYTQKIVYSAYQEPKTTVDIAKELALPEVFVDDEIQKLVENSFMIKKPGNRYLTNIYITRHEDKFLEKIKDIMSAYVKLTCDTYIPSLFKFSRETFYRSAIPRSAELRSACEGEGREQIKDKIYIPFNDFNFLMWFIVNISCKNKFFEIKEDDAKRFEISRKDGAKYVAIAKADYKNIGCKERNFNNVDYFMKSISDEKYPILFWQFLSKYDDRKINQQDNLFLLHETLYDFYTGKFTKESAHIDKYKRLLDNGCIVSKGGSEYVNMIVTTMKSEDFMDLIPEISEDLRVATQSLEKEVYEINKTFYPKHLHELCFFMTKYFLAVQLRLCVFEELLNRAVLKPVKKNQRLTVNSILFSDVLPRS